MLIQVCGYQKSMKQCKYWPFSGMQIPTLISTTKKQFEAYVISYMLHRDRIFENEETRNSNTMYRIIDGYNDGYCQVSLRHCTINQI